MSKASISHILNLCRQEFKAFVSEDLLLRPCLCGSKRLFQDCCALYLSAQATVSQAVQLMRARYCAFYLALPHFLAHTDQQEWDLSNHTELRQHLLQNRWVCLTVLSHSSSNQAEEHWVEFEAYFQDRHTSQWQRLTEKSYFIDTGPFGWTYTHGHPQWKMIQMSRNAMCVCGSQKKWKQCCMRRNQ